MACKKNKEGLRSHIDNGKCRLNADIPIEMAKRLEEVADRSGMTKVGVVCAALQVYFNGLEAQEAIKAKILADPEYVGRMAAAFKEVKLPDMMPSLEGPNTLT